MSKNEIEKGKQLAGELAVLCRSLSDDEVGALFDGGTIDDLLNSIFDATKAATFPNIAEFFLSHKHRASLMAGIRMAIQRSCCIKPKCGRGYVSPLDIQWFENGVMLLEGPSPFEGVISLYRDGKQAFAVAARDAVAGDSLGPDDFLFLDIDAARASYSVPKREGLDVPVAALRELLEANDSEEAKYQS